MLIQKSLIVLLTLTASSCFCGWKRCEAAPAPQVEEAAQTEPGTSEDASESPAS